MGESVVEGEHWCERGVIVVAYPGAGSRRWLEMALLSREDCALPVRREAAVAPPEALALARLASWPSEADPDVDAKLSFDCMTVAVVRGELGRTGS